MKFPYLKCGDSEDELSKLEDGLVDLTVTSPPYDSLREYHSDSLEWGPSKWEAILDQLFRVTAVGGVVVWIVNDAVVNGSKTGSSLRQALFAQSIGFRIHDYMIWCKPSFRLPDSTRYHPATEFMFVFSKGKPKTINLIKDRQNKTAGARLVGSRRSTDGSLLNVKTEKSVERHGIRLNWWLMTMDSLSSKHKHHAPFPLDLAGDHIKTWSKKGDIVLDPFLGSGTTGVAALLNSRKFIGFELDPTFFDRAKERVETRGRRTAVQQKDTKEGFGLI